jgi:hypothetical protein
MTAGLSPDRHELASRLARLRPCWNRPEAFFEARRDLAAESCAAWPTRGRWRPQDARQARRQENAGSRPWRAPTRRESPVCGVGWPRLHDRDHGNGEPLTS